MNCADAFMQEPPVEGLLRILAMIKVDDSRGGDGVVVSAALEEEGIGAIGAGVRADGMIADVVDCRYELRVRC